MIHPTCAEVLATVRSGLEAQIVPHLADGEARSAAATIGHLLRHVALRIEDEGQILTDDIARLHMLLEQIAVWFAANDVGDAETVRGALAEHLPERTYPSLTLLGRQALTLRGALVTAQEVLHDLAATYAGDADYQGLREAIRQYIAAQLADEAKLIAPAFQGMGPRR